MSEHNVWRDAEGAAPTATFRITPNYKTEITFVVWRTIMEQDTAIEWAHHQGFRPLSRAKSLSSETVMIAYTCVVSPGVSESEGVFDAVWVL